MKICAECRWFRPGAEAQGHECGHASAKHVGVRCRVTGAYSVPPGYFTCAEVRERHSRLIALQAYHEWCGSEGRFWEARDEG
jgi:hypothetical protein